MNRLLNDYPGPELDRARLLTEAIAKTLPKAETIITIDGPEGKESYQVTPNGNGYDWKRVNTPASISGAVQGYQG